MIQPRRLETDTKTKTEMKSPYVIYHSNCSDGFCAAYLFKQAYPNAEFIAASYGDDPPPLEPGRPVYIVDFSYDRETLISINEACKPAYLLVLDHHKTAQANCEGLDFCVFDMEKCGAMLALDYLLDNGKIPPCDLTKYASLVSYVGDRDLWLWEMMSSKEVNAAIRSYPMTFDAWDDIVQTGTIRLASEGDAIMRYRRKLIDEHISNARTIDVAGYDVPGVYCSSSEIISEVAGDLAEGNPFAACYFDVDDGRVYSLRSKSDGLDVSEIASANGGGGHKHAAGFKVPHSRTTKAE